MSFAPHAHFDLSRHNTLGLLAHAAWFAEASSVEALCEALAWADTRRLPVMILGGGSNVVFADDWPGLVLRPALRGRSQREGLPGHHVVEVGAGENWHDTVTWTLASGLPGLENLALIPGDAGAAPIQNIGAYGMELSERLFEVEVLDRRDGTLRTLAGAACRFGYRDSLFKQDAGADLVVTAVRLALPRTWQPVTGYRDVADTLAARGIGAPTPQDVFDAVVAIRRAKLPDPALTGNVGSFFKNPVVSHAVFETLRETHPDMVGYPQADGRMKLAAGWLIDRCGWKGRQMGAAGVHPRQALVLVNTGGASGADMLRLAAAIREDVLTRFGVSLDVEPRVVRHVES